MRVVAIGDVGVLDDMMHIGDEAMFEAMCDELAARGATITAVSSAPIDTAGRYGVEAVSRIGFTGLNRQDAESRLSTVLAVAEGRRRLDEDDPALAVMEAVAQADGIVIAGGGNLSSLWPAHVYERAALAGIARRLGRPVVVSGQTLGPDLQGRDEELVQDMVREAALVGVREAQSRDLATRLGAVPRLGVDDASFLGADAGLSPIDRKHVLVSLSLSLEGASREETVRRVARLVDAAVDITGADARFHAHFGALTGDEPRGDALLHEEVRAAMRTPSSAAPTGDPRAAAALARSSALLITGRYHPAVFAAPAGVPILGLTTNAYTIVKQRGALAHWGQSTTVPLPSADDLGIPASQNLWRDRQRIGGVAADLLPVHQATADGWWDQIAEVMSGAPLATPKPSRSASRTAGGQGSGLS